MQVSFEGICLWDTESPQRLLGIMRNASQGDNFDGVDIPPHTACVIVREGAVDDSQWDEAPEPVTFRGAPHLLYRLHGDDISFDPSPAGGSPNISLLPKQFRCPMNGRVLDPALTGNSPSAAAVAARIDIPSTANMIAVRNDLQAASVLLAVADGTRLVARRFDGSVRRMSFLGNDPRVKIANVDLDLAFADPATAVDDNHSGLYCRMFVASAGTAPPSPSRGDLLGGLLFPLEVGDAPRHRESVEAIDRQRRPLNPQRPRRRLGDFLTLGAGCSNSQYP